MKNKLHLLAFIGASTFLLSSCCEKKVDSAGIENKLISVEKGIEIKNLYHNEIGTLINESNGADYQHTEYAWISLDTLKKYVALLDEVENLNHKEVSGIRIYLAKYPLEGKYSDKEKRNLKPGRETVFFAPTMKIDSKDSIINKYQVLQNVPFYIKPTDVNKPYIGTFKEIKEFGFNTAVSNEKVLKTMNKETKENSTSLFMNDLQSFPPPKP